jgi:hypothetical protein
MRDDSTFRLPITGADTKRASVNPHPRRLGLTSRVGKAKWSGTLQRASFAAPRAKRLTYRTATIVDGDEPDAPRWIGRVAACLARHERDRERTDRAEPNPMNEPLPHAAIVAG